VPAVFTSAAVKLCPALLISYVALDVPVRTQRYVTPPKLLLAAVLEVMDAGAVPTRVILLLLLMAPADKLLLFIVPVTANREVDMHPVVVLRDWA
jgi:hypothetical protein